MKKPIWSRLFDLKTVDDKVDDGKAIVCTGKRYRPLDGRDGHEYYKMPCGVVYVRKVINCVEHIYVPDCKYHKGGN